MDFVWNKDKAAINLKRHKISFEEAKTIFDDQFSVTINDPKHSVKEQRYIDIGISAKGNVLVVSYTERETKIRIISCRKATKSEREIYEEGQF
jgi:uncharacterized protein